MADNSALRIEITIRAAMIARDVLQMVGMEPQLVRLLLRDVVQQIQALDAKIKAEQ